MVIGAKPGIDSKPFCVCNREKVIKLKVQNSNRQCHSLSVVLQENIAILVCYRIEN